MMGRSRILWMRTTLADNLAVVIAIVLILGAFGGYLTYTTHVNPGTQSETTVVSSWESVGEFTHHSTVVNATEAFEEGETLRNRTTYFTRTTPRLDGSFTYQYMASSGGELETNTTLWLVLRSLESGSEDEPAETYWRIDRELSRDSVESLSPDERVSTPFSVNVSAVADEVDRVDEQLGGTPGELRIEIVADVSIAGTRNGNPVETTRTYRLPLEPSGSVYRVSDPGTVRADGAERTQDAVPVTYGPLREGGGPVLLLLALVGLVGLGYAQRTGALSLSDRELAWLTFQSERSEFDEWISTGSVGADNPAPTTAELDSLSGLVDVAIDTDSRVIEDTETGSFFVFVEDGRFRFDAPPEPDEPVAELPANQDGQAAKQVSEESADQPDGESADRSTDESNE